MRNNFKKKKISFKPLVTLRLQSQINHQDMLDSSINKDKSFLEKFDSTNKKLNKRMLLLQSENQEFHKSFSISKKHLKYIDPFSDIKELYYEKGYKIPNLSESHNLFNPTPLLMEEKDINTYYKNNALFTLSKDNNILQKTIFAAGKSQKYLLNLKNDILKIQNQRKKMGKSAITHLMRQKREKEDYYNVKEEEKLEKIKERGKFLKNKKENVELSAYNKTIMSIMPEDKTENQTLPSPIKRNSRKLLYNVINHFEDISPSNNINNNEDTYSTDNSPRSTRRTTFKYETRKQIKKHLTCRNSNLKIFFQKKKLGESKTNSPVQEGSLFLFENKYIKNFLNQKNVDRSDLLELERKVNLFELKFVVLRKIIEKYCECTLDPEERLIMIDILNNKDPNGLIKLIAKIKNNINKLEIKGKILEEKKKDKKVKKFYLVNKTINQLDKKFIKNLYHHANID